MPGALVIIGVLAACSSEGNESSTASASSVSTESGPLSQAFASSAAGASVPRDLLVAIAKVEDGLSLPAERLDLVEDNEVPAAGPLMLRRGKLNTLARGAALSGLTEFELRQHADLALHAGALVLAEVGARTGARADDLASWKTAIEEMGGYADEAHRDDYAHRVFATLARGGRFEGRDGEIIVLPRHDLPPSLTLDVSSKLHTLAGKAEYPGAEFFPTSCTNKCDAGRGGNSVDFIVIHDTEGGWDGSVATLQNDPGKSVQYIVGTDGRVGQFVVENTTAYHAGNYNYNQRSVGIEHVGYATKPYPEAEYAASAKLVDYLATKYSVKRDRAHVIGHDQVPNGNKIAQASAPCSLSPKGCVASPNYGGASKHTDPGVWEWPTFMVRFGGNAKCNDVTNLWNCSNDKTQAFRCANDKVEVAVCNDTGGCEVQANGVDDICHSKPVTADAGADSDAGAGDGGASSPSTPPTAGPVAPSPPPTGDTLDAPPSDDSGCSVAGSVGAGKTFGASTASAARTQRAALGTVFGALFALVFTRRRVRRSPVSKEGRGTEPSP